MGDGLKKAAEHWSSLRPSGKERWWNNPAILRHINRLVCGEAIDDPWGGLEQRMKALGRELRRALSVGCGNGYKEIQLLKKGIVQQFDLFEISQARIDQGRVLAVQHGVSGRVRFHAVNAFDQALDRNFDLVYWNNALHHMMDVEAAIRWSHDRLVKGGFFIMDDFIGPSRFQWSDYHLEIASRVRELLPERFLVHPVDPRRRLPSCLTRPSVESLMAVDPTEAADSDNILPALQRVFPNAEVILTGGVIYHLALNDVLANFDDAEDATLLSSLLLLDEVLAKNGDSHYATAIAVKTANRTL